MFDFYAPYESICISKKEGFMNGVGTVELGDEELRIKMEAKMEGSKVDDIG